jgi:hypothetical protein
MDLLVRRGLGLDAGLPSVIAESPRCDLPAGVAVDAARVDEELAGSIFCEAARGQSHGSIVLERWANGNQNHRRRAVANIFVLN